MPEGEVHTVVMLRFQVRVTDFKRQIPGMRSIVVQLFQRWSASRVCVVRNKSAVLPERNIDACRAGESGERSVRTTFGIVTRVFDSTAELETKAVKRECFQSENRVDVSLGRWS